MPPLLDQVNGHPDTYTLYNSWAGDEGYICSVPSNSTSYAFLKGSCAAADALPLIVTNNTAGEYVMRSLGGDYVSYCDGGCAGGRWLAASYSSAGDAMTLKLSDPGVAPPAPPSPPAGQECVQNGTAHYVCQSSGSLSYSSLLDQVFGSERQGWDGYNPCCPDAGSPPMCANRMTSGCTQKFPKGMPQDGWMKYSYVPEVMHQFSPEEVPVHIKLAQEFALMDKYYTSFPGPSTPNHLFIMSATSAGCTTTGEDYQCTSGKKFPQKTIFESLARQVSAAATSTTHTTATTST